MLFSPNNSKFKKYQKGSITNKLQNNFNLNKFSNNFIKLISNEFGDLTVKQLTSIRFLIKKFIKKKGLVKFSVFPQRFISKKPLEIRMGKGKGNFSHWSAKVKQGTVICEILYKKRYLRSILKVLKRAQIRLPLKTLIKL